MSIWTSVDRDIAACLLNDYERSLRGEGTPGWTLAVDTATSRHDKVRVHGWTDTTEGSDWLLDEANAAELRDALTEALERLAARRAKCRG
jgi:succinate dehydrogenase/fumarate reductase flavoprotein subunit